MMRRAFIVSVIAAGLPTIGPQGGNGGGAPTKWPIHLVVGDVLVITFSNGDTWGRAATIKCVTLADEYSAQSWVLEAFNAQQT